MNYRRKKVNKENNGINNFFKRFLLKIMICLVIVLLFMIGIKKLDGFDKFIYEKVYNRSFSFAKLNALYNSYFGKLFPIKNKIEDDVLVYNESLDYNEIHEYKEGVSLDVDDNYIVPFIRDGIVVFIGEKEGYGNVIIVEDEEGVDIWYSNIINSNVNIYDYVKKGDLIGNVLDNKLILVFQKNGKRLDYQEYI